MGTFTKLGATELAALADAFGLGAVLSHRAIAAGTINSNYELVTASGRFFLRINEGKCEADVAWEAQLVGALAAANVTTPAPLVARDGRPYAAHGDKWASVFAWRDGEHVHEVTPRHAEVFGAALAALHVAGLALPAAWRRASIYDHAHIVARFESFAHAPDPQLAHAIAILGEELAIANDAMPIRARATHGIIHGDLFRDNVLWQDERITAILDFEQASGGSLAYDLAVCINDWCFPAIEHQPVASIGHQPVASIGHQPVTSIGHQASIGHEPVASIERHPVASIERHPVASIGHPPGPSVELAQALVAGYERVRRLPDVDREALPYEIRAAAARFTITRITDVYLANVPNPAKDFRDFLSRCEAWRSPALGQLTRAL